MSLSKKTTFLYPLRSLSKSQTEKAACVFPPSFVVYLYLRCIFHLKSGLKMKLMEYERLFKKLMNLEAKTTPAKVEDDT